MITQPTNKSEARAYAVEMQHHMSKKSMSYGELAMHQAQLYKIGKRFGLIKEFRENGLL